MTPKLQVQQFEDWLRPFGRVLVAYSGGVDSALVMAMAHRLRGEHALACVGISPSYPLREQRDAVALAERLGVPVRKVETQEHLDPYYIANDGSRCYHCKTHLYDRLRDIMIAEKWDVILDGTNADDLGDDRPGRVAAAEHGVRSPLVELGWSKNRVRELAKFLGLEVWDKPAMACLSSRVPRGTAVTPQLLSQIEQAEDVLVELGLTQFRVRHHGEIARIELPPSDFEQALEHRIMLVRRLRVLGYKHVTLDLAGFRDEGLMGVTVRGEAMQ